MAQTGLLSFAQAAHLLLVYGHLERVFLLQQLFRAVIPEGNPVLFLLK
jgi:hypothetical protein